MRDMSENHDFNPDRPTAAPEPDTRRFDVVDRRSGLDRRELAALKAAVGDLDTSDEPVSGLERRRGPGRRRSDFLKSAEEGQLNREQFLFLMAIEEFKRANDRAFPSWTDVLEVIRLLGYRKTMPSQLRLTSAEDWKESAEAPSNVRPARWSERFRKGSAGPSAEAA
jgi:hypothetical protein